MMQGYWRTIIVLGLALVTFTSPITSFAKGSGSTRTAQPECAAIILPGIPAGTTDGEQQAGFYKSSLGRLELHADVSAGVARDYNLNLPGRSLIPAARPWPRPVMVCLKAKGVAKSLRQTEDCRGGRFKIIMTRAGSTQYLLLYAMTKPEPWHLCRAVTVVDSGVIPPE